MFDTNMRYVVFKDYGITFDEKGSSCGCVRKAQWVREGHEPDESKAKIEIRKSYVNSDEEKVGKGYAFVTEEGPGELVVGMIGAGFGDTKEILRAVRKREDFLEAANTINEDNDDGVEGEEMFDMRKLLLGMEEDSSDEELDDAC